MPKYIDFDALGVQSCNPDVFVNKGYAEGWNSLMRILYDAPAADVEPKREWIPVTEDKPHSIVNKVLVFCQGEDIPDYIGFAHYEKYHGEETWFNLESDEPFESWGLTVTHWMKKPEPPKEEDDAKQ